jgi:ceramide glucosyltransferase
MARKRPVGLRDAHRQPLPRTKITIGGRLVNVLVVTAIVGLLSNTVYLSMAAIAARRFLIRRRHRREPVPTEHRLTRISVLKPVHGPEPRLEECLESFFRQNYSDFELIFGARGPDDPAVETIERLRARYPAVPAKMVFSGDPHYSNAKISALEQMVTEASAQLLFIADSDVRVEPDYLTQVASPLLDPANGVVTCLYRGVSAGGWWSALEALGMSVEMSSGVLVADMLEGMRFALGPTMAMRREVLERIGGIGVLGAYHADDYVLGQRAHAAGYHVVLSHHVIEHVAVNRSLRGSLRHHLRWMRSTRFSRPVGHLGAVFTFATPFGVVGFTAAMAGGRPKLATALLFWSLASSLLQCVAIGWGVVRDRAALTRCVAYPFRDLLGFAAWCGSFFGSAIVWRGEVYDLEEDGTMRPRAAGPSGRGVASRARREAV